MQDSNNQFSSLFQVKTPEFLLVADKPIHLGGVPQKISIKEAEEKFKFQYCENILISKTFPDFKFNHPSENNDIWKQINDRLKNPLNDKLVICFIDHHVGYGVFANDFIEAGTIIGIYAGEIEKIVTRSDYGMSIAKTNLTINAEKIGGLTRFIQHMPYSFANLKNAILNANLDKLIKLLQGNGIFFDAHQLKQLKNPGRLESTKSLNITELDKRTLASGEQDEMLENNRLASIPNLATANVSAFFLNYPKKPIIFLRTLVDIHKGEQLGITYGQEYWDKKRLLSEYFDNRGNIIPRTTYIPALNVICEKYSSKDAADTLHRAAFEGDIYDVKVLLSEYHFPINDQTANVHQRTPLHLAVIGYAVAVETKREDIAERKKIIELLIDYGADRDILDKYNRGALHYAVLNSLTDIAGMFLNYGAAVNNKDQIGQKPFDYNPQMARQLLEDSFIKLRADLLSRYIFNKVSDQNEWGEDETSAGLYVDNITTNQVLIVFGKKNNKLAISVTNHLENAQFKIQDLKQAMSLFQEITATYLCRKSLSKNKNFSVELEKHHITFKTSDIDDDCDILAAEYIFVDNEQGKIRHPRIAYLNENDLKNFYGELANHTHSIPSKNAKTFIETRGSASVIEQLNKITNSLDDAIWSKYKGREDSFALKTDDENIAKEIHKQLCSKNLGTLKVLGGNKVVIENINTDALKQITPLVSTSTSGKNEVETLTT